MRLIKLHDGVSTSGPDWFEDDKGIRHPVYSSTIPLLAKGDATYLVRPDANDMMRIMKIAGMCMEVER